MGPTRLMNDARARLLYGAVDFAHRDRSRTTLLR
jgi:hypothetical protein